MNAGNCAAIILAAGFSSRMKDFKPLLTLGGVTVADRVIALFRESGIEVIFVTGWRQDELIAGISSKGITIAENPDFKTGMLSSVQAGIRQLQPEHTAFFLMPVDIPLVSPATIKRILACAEENPEKIVYPVFNGKRGHPPLIPASLADEILGWQGEGGLNTILALHREMQVEISVADGNILADADNRDDFSLLEKRFETYDIPDESECRALLDIAGTPENVRAHCRKVAEVAVALGQALLEAGHKADIGEIRAAALLHDIAKSQANHQKAGAGILTEHGFERIGDIISIHQDLVEDTASVDIETKIVYFADKIVNEQTVVSVEERFRGSAKRYGHIPEAAEKIRNARVRALRVKEELEKLLGYPMENITERLSS